MAGNPLANFGAGFLGGYRDVLGMKMKEDAQAKRDEALANRQMNLEKLRQEFEGKQRGFDRDLRQQEIQNTKTYHEEQLKLQREQLRAHQAAASAARRANSPEEKLRERKLFDAYEAEQVTSFAQKEEARVLKSGGTKEEAIAAAALAEGLGVKNRKELTAATANTDFMKTVNNVRQEAVKGASAKLAEWESMGKDGQEQLVIAATNMGWEKGKGDLGAFYMRSKVASAVSAISPSSVSPKKEGPSVSTTTETVFSPAMVKNYASAIMDMNSGRVTEEQANKFNTEVLPNYKKLTPEQKEEIQREINTRKSRPGVLKGFSSDLYDVFSKE